MIYLIQDSTTCHIKIGFTADNAEDRLKTLQTGNPSALVLLCTQSGSMQRETALHKLWAKHRVQGEWFRPHPDIIRFFFAQMFDAGKEQGRTERNCNRCGKMTTDVWADGVCEACNEERCCACGEFLDTANKTYCADCLSPEPIPEPFVIPF